MTDLSPLLSSWPISGICTNVHIGTLTPANTTSIVHPVDLSDHLTGSRSRSRSVDEVQYAHTLLIQVYCRTPMAGTESCSRLGGKQT